MIARPVPAATPTLPIATAFWPIWNNPYATSAAIPLGHGVMGWFGCGLCANTGIRRVVVVERRISPEAIIT